MHYSCYFIHFAILVLKKFGLNIWAPIPIQWHINMPRYPPDGIKYFQFTLNTFCALAWLTFTVNKALLINLIFVTITRHYISDGFSGILILILRIRYRFDIRYRPNSGTPPPLPLELKLTEKWGASPDTKIIDFTILNTSRIPRKTSGYVIVNIFWFWVSNFLSVSCLLVICILQ